MRMPRVKICVFADLRDLLGFSVVDLDTQPESVRELIGTLSRRYNRRFRRLLIDRKTGDLKRFYKILVNGRDIDFLDMLDTRLKDGDELSFFSPAGGG
jgi:molybdopterin synthase sulfur carrier subunit